MNPLDIEIRAWPPGNYSSSGVIALHVPTGVAVVVRSEPNRERNQRLAVERVHMLIGTLPWSGR
jgi:hypothetical protein